ncbi:hypothetical protein QWY99_21630 [Flavobacterium branchiarum]|uniref:DUF2946 domain-containing protein n=1 Tax=Flavobacterium branchiarum TaxID=1114870 RepID=A0ABV5FJ41_9FLAO|nr:hypothetical protein [Flavobacterium branchiarum]MDN3675637.1 hypothetical protein [Flavobacterium branchiarum]
MKKKQFIISFSLAMTILFSMLFQSVHSYEHIVQEFSEKQCHHEYNVTNTEITHQHHNFDFCYVCHFALSSYITPEKFTFQVPFFQDEIPYFFPFSEKPVLFSGSLYSLRGPPVV